MQHAEICFRLVQSPAICRANYLYLRGQPGNRECYPISVFAANERLREFFWPSSEQSFLPQESARNQNHPIQHHPNLCIRRPVEAQSSVEFGVQFQSAIRQVCPAVPCSYIWLIQKSLRAM